MCLYKNCNFVLIFSRYFIAMPSPLKVASTQQPRYSIYEIVLFYCYRTLSSGRFFPYWNECIYFHLHQNELTTYYQQTSRIHSHIPCLKHFQFRYRPYVDKKIVSSTYKYAWLFGRACIISFGTKYSMDQVKFFKGCLPQILPGPLLRILCPIYI